jgi:hypothetical protein
LANENALGLGGSAVAVVAPGADGAGVPNVKGLLVTAGLPSLSPVLAPKVNLGTLAAAVVVAAVVVVVMAAVVELGVELVVGREKLNGEEDAAAVEIGVAGFVVPNVKLGVVAGLFASAVLVAGGAPKLKGDAAVLEVAGVAAVVLGVSAGLPNENPPNEGVLVEAAGVAAGLVLPNVNGAEVVVAGLSEVAEVDVGKVKGDVPVEVAAVDVVVAGALVAAGAPNENGEAGVVDLVGVLKLNADGAAEVLAVVEAGALNINADGVVDALAAVEVGVLNEKADGAAEALAAVEVGVVKLNAEGVVAAGVLKEIAED